MPDILLIGGCGYIGSALDRHLNLNVKGDGDTILTVDLEWFGNTRLGNQRVDYRTLTGQEVRRFDVVIVAAAHSSVAMCQKDPYGAFQNNVVNFVNLLQKMQAGQKLIYMSSSCVYTGFPVLCDEQTPLLPPCDHLTLTKQTIDKYAQFSDVEYYALRLGSVNGWSPNLRSDLMINAMTMNALETGEVRVSNGLKYRPILAMQDLCRAVERIVECREDHRGIYNVASFNKQIRDIGEVVAAMTDATVVGGNFTGGYDFQMWSWKFCNTFGWYPEGDVASIVGDLRSHLKPNRLIGSRDVNMEYKGV